MSCLLGAWTILGCIILFDSIALGIATGVWCNQFTAIHPALRLVIVIATFLLPVVAAKHQRRLSGLSADFAFYAAAFRLLAYFVLENDPIWCRVIFGIAFLVASMLHLRAWDN